jgi:hypothetical protein
VGRPGGRRLRRPRRGPAALPGDRAGGPAGPVHPRSGRPRSTRRERSGRDARVRPRPVSRGAHDRPRRRLHGALEEEVYGYYGIPAYWEDPRAHDAGHMRPDDEPPEVRGAGWMDPARLEAVKLWRRSPTTRPARPATVGRAGLRAVRPTSRTDRDEARLWRVTLPPASVSPPGWGLALVVAPHERPGARCSAGKGGIVRMKRRLVLSTPTGSSVRCAATVAPEREPSVP